MGPSLIGEKTGAPVGAGGRGLRGRRARRARRRRLHRRRTARGDPGDPQPDRRGPSASTCSCPPPPWLPAIRPTKTSREIKLVDALGMLPHAHREWFLKTKEELGLPDSGRRDQPGHDDVSGRMRRSRPCASKRRVPLFCAGLGNPGFMVEAAHAAGMKVLGIAGNAKNVRSHRRRRRRSRGGPGTRSGRPHGPRRFDGAVAPGHRRGCARARARRRRHRRRPGSRRRARHGLHRASGSAPASSRRRRVGRSTCRSRPSSTPADEDTRRTTIYTGKTSRATYNRFHDLWEESGLEPLNFPVQVVLASAIVDMFNQAGNVEYVGPFAGQVSGLIDEIKPAARSWTRWSSRRPTS